MFHIGQKVACVDDSPGFNTGEKHLKLGKVYVVGGFDTSPLIGLFLEGVPITNRYPDGTPVGWWHERFRPVVERKTDISIFTEMLKTRELALTAGMSK